MKAIFASKMYAASKNKDKINAAISDPLNKELVLQLKEYLQDEKLETPSEERNQTNEEPTGAIPKGVEPAGSKPSNSAESKPFTFTPAGGSPSSLSEPEDGENVDDDISQSNGEPSGADDELEVDEETLDSTDDSDDIDSNTASSGQPITASQSIDDVPTELKGTLNMRTDTEGVARARIKDNELWIHYNDNVNLNNVMGPVIELLNSASYSFLEFNRLARTENAIVFEVSHIDTLNTVEPVGGSEE